MWTPPWGLALKPKCSDEICEISNVFKGQEPHSKPEVLTFHSSRLESWRSWVESTAELM